MTLPRLTLLTALLALLLSPGRSAATPKDDADAAWQGMQYELVGMEYWWESSDYARINAEGYFLGGGFDVYDRASKNSEGIKLFLSPQECTDLWTGVGVCVGEFSAGTDDYGSADTERKAAKEHEKTGDYLYSIGLYTNAKASYDKAATGYFVASNTFYDSYAHYSASYPGGMIADTLLHKAGY